MNTPPSKYCFGFPALTAFFSVCFLALDCLANPLPPIQAVRWETDLNVAAARAEREQLPLFLHFTGGDGSSAQQAGSEIFAQPNIASHLNANYVMVKINAVENPAFAKQLSVESVPTDLIIKPSGQVIFRRAGVIPADKFAMFLTFLQEKIQAEKNQVSVQTPGVSPPVTPPASPAPSAAGPFPLVNPQVSSPPVSPPAAALPGAVPPVSTPPDTLPLQQNTNTSVPGAVRDPLAQQSPTAQYPPLTQYPQPPPFAQNSPAVAGAMAAGTPATNPLRGAEIAARPAAAEQNTPSANAAMQAMLDAPAPPKMTIEVPLALEGFCPVMLCTEERWVAGNPAYCTMYQGHVFRFSSANALVTFAQNPANFTPVAMGEDIVLKVDRNRRVNGDRRFGAWFQGRVFLFSSQETFSAFEARPDYYAEIALKYETARRESPAPIVY